MQHRPTVFACLGVALILLPVASARAETAPSHAAVSIEAIDADAHADAGPARPAVDASTAAPAPRAAWSASEIDAARARCRALLSGVEAVTIAVEPIREGNCGAPAPVQLVSLGSKPQIAFSPPPTLTCELAAALGKWLQADVQPAAREILGGPLVRLEIMSSYSCRNAYARAKSRLSEHGRANALDIARFITDRGEGAAVVADWGMTERDVRRQIAAAQAAAAKQAKEAAGRPAPADRAVAAAAGAKPVAVASDPDGLRGSIAGRDTVGQASTLGLVPGLPGGGLPSLPSLGLTAPSKLGGPAPQDQQGAHQRFLHRIHTAGCGRFGTILGPEANDAHRNHFHVDMAERQGKPFCE